MSTYKKVELLNPTVADEVLHPVTTAEAVKFADGTTLDTARTTISRNITLSTIWDVDTGSYTQTFTDADITTNSEINIAISKTATDAEVNAFNALDLVDGGQTNGSFTIKCRSDVLNSISIPLTYTATIVKMALIDDGTASSLLSNINTHKNRTDNPHNVTKAQVGLGNVDNTSDADKPISNATQTALNSKSTRHEFTANVTTVWVGASAPYTQDVTVTGILADDDPIINPVYSATNATAILEKAAWGNVGKVVTTLNTITLTCFEEKPATAFNLQLLVVR